MPPERGINSSFVGLLFDIGKIEELKVQTPFAKARK